MQISLKDLNGISLDELDNHIRQFPIDFSTENNVIQYLGWSVELREGKIFISDSDRANSACKSLLKHLTTLNKDVGQQLSG
ncbi:MAG: hypothetical protein ACPGEF_04475 [Endozoicomonas sp.]